MKIKEELTQRVAIIEEYLQGLNSQDMPKSLKEAMDYSLLAGGKRIRPVLFLSWYKLYSNQDITKILPFAAALECIHTYSLIHDDLPAMDDDDFRRGRPSNHKQFNEATAILAGDGLLSDAFYYMSQTAKDADADFCKRVLSAINVVSSAIGSRGMVGGQMLDMDFSGKKDISLIELQKIHALKTGALLEAACVCGAILAGANDEEIARAQIYGKHIGITFQVVDDILDVIGDEAELGKPVGSDIAHGKCTYPSFMGLEKSRAYAKEQIVIVQDTLTAHAGNKEQEFLLHLADYLLERAN